MTETELIKYYANKIVEDGLIKTSECNYIADFDEYQLSDFINMHKEKILWHIKRDEKISDVYIRDNSFDMVFWLDYRPSYYIEDIIDTLDKKKEEEVFKKFYKYIQDINKSKRNIEFYLSTRLLIDNFIVNIDKNIQEPIYNRIKQILSESGFNDRNLYKYEVLIDSKNINELAKIVANHIEYVKNCINEKEDEEESEG